MISVEILKIIVRQYLDYYIDIKDENGKLQMIIGIQYTNDIRAVLQKDSKGKLVVVYSHLSWLEELVKDINKWVEV